MLKEVWSERIVPFVVVATVAPAILAAVFINNYAVNTFILDDFAFVPLFQELYEGKLNPSFLFLIYNNHPYGLAELLLLLIGFTTRLNVIAEMYFSWALLLATMMVLAAICQKYLDSAPTRALLFFSTALILFNFHNYEIFLYGINFTYALPLFLSTLSIRFIDAAFEEKNDFNRYLSVAILSAFLSLFSGSLQGALIWPIGFIQLFFLTKFEESEEKQRAGKRFQMIWLGFTFFCTALLVCCISMIDYLLAQRGIPPQFAAAIAKHHAFNPIEAIKFSLTLFGSLFCNADLNSNFVRTMGGATLSLFFIAAAMVRKEIILGNRNKLFLVASAIASIGLLSNLMISAGRSGMGLEQAFSPRYGLFTAFGLIGLLLIFTQVKHSPLKAKVLLSFTLFLIASTYIHGYMNAEPTGKILRKAHLEAASILLNYRRETDDRLSRVFPFTELLKRRAAFLEAHKLSVFGDSSLQKQLAKPE